MLENEAGIEIVGEAADGREFLELVAGTQVELALLDVRMPKMTGLEALAELSRRGIEVKVIMLSMHDEGAYVKRAVELGASGYLLKNAGRDELLRAIETVASGGVYVQGELAGPLVQSVTGNPEDATVVLSPRERDVLGLAAAGMENKQMARELGIAEATVKTYLASAYERLGATGRAEAVARAIRLGLID